MFPLFLLAPLLPLAWAAPEDEAALSEHWLVILASHEDPTAPVPALELLAQHPELGASPRTLSSSRFKNLMPCYTVTVAGASPEKAEALDLSQRLRALGVDHYVKQAGAWVGPSAQVDAWCDRGPAPEAGTVRVLAAADGALWVPVDLPVEVGWNLLESAPPPVPVSPQYDAWRQALPVQAAGDIAAGSPWTVVETMAGQRLSCTVSGFAGLTLGIPHFGVLQQEAPPTAPACGSPAIFARLDCDPAPGAGYFVGAPTQAGGMVVYTPEGPAPAALEAAAREALVAETDWEIAEADPELVERELSVSTWRGPGGRFALVEGRRRIDGGCGGEQTVWSAVYQMKGNRLGSRLGGFVQAQWADSVGLVDVDGDGRPERVVTTFPATTSVVGDDGVVRAEQATDYCDCPC